MSGGTAVSGVGFGRVLPEPGAEEAWRKAMSVEKLEDLKRSGAI